MKRVKNNAASFQKLSAVQLKNIQGGYWITITTPDGKDKTIWVEP
jgi:hypothetical protein